LLFYTILEMRDLLFPHPARARRLLSNRIRFGASGDEREVHPPTPAI
jgi:hypothetical protein